MGVTRHRHANGIDKHRLLANSGFDGQGGCHAPHAPTRCCRFVLRRVRASRGVLTAERYGPDAGLHYLENGIVNLREDYE